VGSYAFLAAAVAMTAAVAAWLVWSVRRRAVPPAEPAGGEDAPAPPSPLRRRSIAAMVIALPVMAAGLYAWLGEPAALADASSLDAQGALDALPATAVREELVAHLARNPRDARGHVLLARLEAAQDNFPAAATAYRNAIAASGKVANDPAILCEYADALGMAQGGSLAGPPLELVMRALAIAPAHPRALEMAGSAAFEQQDYANALRHWRTLQAQLAADDPQARDLAGAIARVELVAGTAKH
jgi:cytochrome c-type biogenesis protein CcmH